MGVFRKDPPTRYWIHDYIEAPEPNVAIAIAVVSLTLFAIIYIAFSKPKAALTRSKDFMRFKLVQKRRISPNTAQYRFALPRSTDYLGLPIGQHISVQAKINGKNVQRSYTPVSSDEDTGFFDLMIKSYPQGNISKHVGEMNIGDYLEVKGPKGQMKYTPDLSKNIGMIAGGTGITPMLQIIRAALKNADDPTQLSLIYANVKPEDILLKDELDQLASEHKDRFKVYYVLNEPTANWDGGKGFVTKEIIQERLKGPQGGASESKVLLCGPPPMIKAMKGALEELGYEKANTVSKLPDQTFSF